MHFDLFVCVCVEREREREREREIHYLPAKSTRLSDPCSTCVRVYKVGFEGDTDDVCFKGDTD